MLNQKLELGIGSISLVNNPDLNEILNLAERSRGFVLIQCFYVQPNKFTKAKSFCYWYVIFEFGRHTFLLLDVFWAMQISVDDFLTVLKPGNVELIDNERRCSLVGSVPLCDEEIQLLSKLTGKRIEVVTIKNGVLQ